LEFFTDFWGMFVDPKKRICLIYLISAIVIGVVWGAIVQKKPIVFTLKKLAFCGHMVVKIRTIRLLIDVRE
jgi:hypothetical protein